MLSGQEFLQIFTEISKDEQWTPFQGSKENLIALYPEPFNKRTDFTTTIL